MIRQTEDFGEFNLPKFQTILQFLLAGKVFGIGLSCQEGPGLVRTHQFSVQIYCSTLTFQNWASKSKVLPPLKVLRLKLLHLKDSPNIPGGGIGLSSAWESSIPYFSRCFWSSKMRFWKSRASWLKLLDLLTESLIKAWRKCLVRLMSKLVRLKPFLTTIVVATWPTCFHRVMSFCRFIACVSWRGISHASSRRSPNKPPENFLLYNG